jgi:hypothetical protein
MSVTLNVVKKPIVRKMKPRPAAATNHPGMEQCIQILREARTLDVFEGFWEHVAEELEELVWQQKQEIEIYDTAYAKVGSMVKFTEHDAEYEYQDVWLALRREVMKLSGQKGRNRDGFTDADEDYLARRKKEIDAKVGSKYEFTNEMAKDEFVNEVCQLPWNE